MDKKTPYFDEFRQNASLPPYSSLSFEEDKAIKKKKSDLTFRNSPEKILSSIDAILYSLQQSFNKMTYYSKKIRQTKEE